MSYFIYSIDLEEYVIPHKIIMKFTYFITNVLFQKLKLIPQPQNNSKKCTRPKL